MPKMKHERINVNAYDVPPMMMDSRRIHVTS